MDLSRLTILSKIHEKRSYILSAIETYILKSSSSTNASFVGTSDQSSENVRRSFVQILRKQQEVRRELMANGGGGGGVGSGMNAATLSSKTIRRMNDRYVKWDENRLSKLLSLLNDLYRQVIALISEANQIDPSDIDMQVVAAITGKASIGKINFNLISTIYSVVFKLM